MPEPSSPADLEEARRRERLRSELRTLLIRMVLLLFVFIVLGFMGLGIYNIRWKGERVVMVTKVSFPEEQVVGVATHRTAGGPDGPFVLWYPSTGNVAVAGWCVQESAVMTIWDRQGVEIGKIHHEAGVYWGEGDRWAPPGWTGRAVTREEMDRLGFPERPRWFAPWADWDGIEEWQKGPSDWRHITDYWGRYPWLAQ